MNTLHVYADECGVMPLDDQDGPFVGATVSAIQPITGLLNLRFDRALLLAHLNRTASTPFFAHVQPFSGYGKQVAAKFGEMDTTARARSLATADNLYLPRRGIAVRNMVWVHSVTQVVGQAFAKYAFGIPIVRLMVTFDQKTLSPESRRLVIDACRQIPKRLRAVIENSRSLNPQQADSALSNIQVTSSDVVVQWSDERAAAGTEDGLLLADRLAWHYRKHLLNPMQPSFMEALAQAGHADIAVDITSHVVSPIRRDAVGSSARDIGLPKPEARWKRC